MSPGMGAAQGGVQSLSGARGSLETLVSRFDASAFDAPRGRARIRLSVRGVGDWDVLIENRKARLADAGGRSQPEALLSADLESWQEIAEDIRSGMDAFRSRRLSVRRNLHLGVGFLAATTGAREPGRLVFRRLGTRVGDISSLEAGQGEPILMLHGLGATKASFLPSVAALAASHRVIAIDLPGFGDSDKPLAAPYDARFFADAVVAVLDVLELERTSLVGNSMGGRVALEVGLRTPERADKLVLLCTALAAIRPHRLSPIVRLLRPELGLLQITPRRPIERFVRSLIPGGHDGWAAAGVDEFLRAYTSPRGRAAFYAAGRHLLLESPQGENGFWPRLKGLSSECLFVWGRYDRLVPISFARHIEAALPHAEHLELACGHVPQFELPAETHGAISDFLADQPVKRPEARARRSG
jgi:pimeloyl-ACP methyl ester carboxylesterase